MNLCRCNKCCPYHSKDMACPEYRSTPLKWVRNFDPRKPEKKSIQIMYSRTHNAAGNRETHYLNIIPRSRLYEEGMICAATHFSLFWYLVVSTSHCEDSSKSPDDTNAKKQSESLKYDMAHRNDALQILHRKSHSSSDLQRNLASRQDFEKDL